MNSPYSVATAKIASRIFDDLDRIKDAVSGINFDAIPEEESYNHWTAARANEQNLNELAHIFEMWQTRFGVSNEGNSQE